jgi:hypothetical protein
LQFRKKPVVRPFSCSTGDRGTKAKPPAIGDWESGYDGEILLHTQGLRRESGGTIIRGTRARIPENVYEMDMSQFIVAKSDQLNADDLLGGPRTITITGVRGTDAADQPVAVNYEGDAGKPYKPCKSMRRVMVHCWGKDAAKYAGRSMTLYCDPDVQFGGMKVGGIRISHMSDIDGKKQMALTATRGKKGSTRCTR